MQILIGTAGPLFKPQLRLPDVSREAQMAVGQNQWYHFGVGALPILVYFSWDWDVHWGYGLLNHSQIIGFCAISVEPTARNKKKAAGAQKNLPAP